MEAAISLEICITLILKRLKETSPLKLFQEIFRLNSRSSNTFFPALIVTNTFSVDQTGRLKLRVVNCFLCTTFVCFPMRFFFHLSIIFANLRLPNYRHENNSWNHVLAKIALSKNVSQGIKNRNSVLNRVAKLVVFVLDRVRV